MRAEEAALSFAALCNVGQQRTRPLDTYTRRRERDLPGNRSTRHRPF
jgi:hypothetical protein